MAQRAEQSRAIQKREVILRAAIEILLNEGLREVTHRQVAARAGVPVGSIGYYYVSREKLLETCFTELAKVRTMIAEEQLGLATSTDSDDLVAWRLVESLTLGSRKDLPGLIGALIDGLREPGTLSGLVTELYADSVVEAEKILKASNVALDAVNEVVDAVVGSVIRAQLEKDEQHPSIVETVAAVIARHR